MSKKIYVLVRLLLAISCFASILSFTSIDGITQPVGVSLLLVLILLGLYNVVVMIINMLMPKRDLKDTQLSISSWFLCITVLTLSYTAVENNIKEYNKVKSFLKSDYLLDKGEIDIKLEELNRVKKELNILKKYRDSSLISYYLEELESIHISYVNILKLDNTNSKDYLTKLDLLEYQERILNSYIGYQDISLEGILLLKFHTPISKIASANDNWHEMKNKAIYFLNEGMFNNLKYTLIPLIFIILTMFLAGYLRFMKGNKNINK